MKSLSISLIGSGNTSWQLAHHFVNSQIGVNAIFTRNPEENQWIQQLGVSAEIFSSASQIESDVVFLTVPDDQVSVMSASQNLKGKTIVHCSGSVDMTAISGSGDKGVFYPLQTLTKHRYLEPAQIPIFIEANNAQLQNQLVELARTIGFPVEVLDSEKRRQLHLCAVMVNNFTNHLLTKAFGLADKSNVQGNRLLPLAFETLAKFKELGGEKAQTGPAKRKDHSTIANHLGSLEGTTLKDLYEVFTQSILKDYE